MENIVLQLNGDDEHNKYGIYQKIFINDEVGFDFYIYTKSEIPGEKWNLVIMDSMCQKELFRSPDCITDSIWKKTYLTVPAFKDQYQICVMIQYSGTKSIEFDEASLMPSNNFLGIRNEHKKLFDILKPGIMRYPGGCFADNYSSDWLKAVGSIDQRKSPNYGYGPFSQRMDFGTDEYMKICKALSIEPYLVVNFGSGTPELAKNWVEYCNGDTNTIYGKLRTANGHSEPYNVKYWEIGNEQWDKPKEYALRYLQYYDEMKKVDSTLKIIIDGNCWDQYSFDTLLSTAKEKCQIYSYHPVRGLYRYAEGSDLEKYKAIVSDNGANDLIKFYESKKEEYKLNNLMITSNEWWTSYSKNNWDMILDTNDRNSSLEAGLSNALEYLIYSSNPQIMDFACRTIGIGFIRNEINSNGEKVIYGTPSFWAISLASNVRGSTVYKTNMICDNYHQYIPAFWVENSSWVNSFVTGTKDTIYIAIINKYLSDSTFVDLHTDFKIKSDTMKVYEMYSNDFLDANTADHPNKIVPTVRTALYSNSLYVKNHSLTIFAIPIDTEIRFDTNRLIVNPVIYPNPVTDFLQIGIKIGFNPNPYENVFVETTIYNIIGDFQFYNSAMSVDNTIRINCSTLSKGFYIAKIKIGNETFAKSFIKI